jgi:hypothetical protein
MAGETYVIRGRLILVNLCLSSIPTYMMGFYHLTDGQHKELNTIGVDSFGKKGAKCSNITWQNGTH